MQQLTAEYADSAHCGSKHSRSDPLRILLYLTKLLIDAANYI